MGLPVTNNSLYRASAVIAAVLVMGCADNITEGVHPLSSDEIVSEPEDTTSPQKIRDENNSTSRSDVIARSAESHSHGKAELAVVLEAGKVTIEFQTPLYNVLGFEQAPNTEAQKDRVSHAEIILGQAPKLFTFNDKALATSLLGPKILSCFPLSMIITTPTIMTMSISMMTKRIINTQPSITTPPLIKTYNSLMSFRAANPRRSPQ